jgi:hypothetical protein
MRVKPTNNTLKMFGYKVKIRSVRNEGILSDERFVRNSFEECPQI